jgi:transposase
MESMPAAAIAVTVGVDTHLDQHVAAVIDQTGRLCGTQTFVASTRGYVAPVTWAEHFGPLARIGIEGTGTYGAGLARFARAYGLQVLEVDRPDRSTRRRRANPIRSTPRPPPGPPWPGWPPPPLRPATARSR